MKIERVLLIDDDSANSLFFEMILENLDIKPTSITAGEEALEVIKKNHPQFLILAWELSSMPGTLLVQKARAMRKKRHIPFLIYSKRMSVEDVELAREMGFKDILSMPFDKVQAKEMIESVLAREENLDPTEALLRKIENHLYGDKPGEAVKLIKPKLYKAGPLQSRSYATTAEIWLRMGKLDRAMVEINKSLESDETNSKAMQVKAKIMSTQGNHEEAITILKKLRASSPKNMSTMVGLGSAYIFADQHENAKKVFDEVMKMDESFQPAKDEMAVMAFKEGDFPLASQLITETDFGDDLARTFNNMAISHVKGDKFDEGIATYFNAIKILAQKANTHLLLYNLALAYKKKGDLAEAFKYFCEAYLSNPSYEKAYISIAKSAKKMKEEGKKPDKELVAKVKQVRSESKDKVA